MIAANTIKFSVNDVYKQSYQFVIFFILPQVSFVTAPSSHPTVLEKVELMTLLLSSMWRIFDLFPLFD